MGKTRLVQEAASWGGALGHRVLWGRCWEAVDAPPYWPWVQVLRQAIAGSASGDIRTAVTSFVDVGQLVSRSAQTSSGMEADATPHSANRFELFDSVISFLRQEAEKQPTLVILEDLHAADESSLHLLHFATTQERKAGLVIVGTYDEVAGRGRPHHDRILSEIAREGRRLSLAGLDQKAIREMYESAAGPLASEATTRAIHEVSEGNPLFVEETVRMLTTKGDLRRPDHSIGFRVPEGVRGIVRRRLDALSSEVRELLSVASVLGREFDLDLLQKVVDVELEPLLDMLGSAVGADVISETSALGRYSFNHILIRETLYEDLSAARRMRLHRTVADTIEKAQSEVTSDRLPELAHHWFKAAQAGDASKTLEYALQAAEQATAQQAHEEAVRLYQRALKVSVAAGADREMIETIRSGLAASRSPEIPPDKIVSSVSSGLFTREGDYWTITYAGYETRLKDVKGLRYISQLLKAPGRELHVLDLATLVEGVPTTAPKDRSWADELRSDGLGDAGEVLDAQAKAAYKSRLMDLQREVDEAREYNDLERAARSQQEIEAIVDQLASGVGLGGRDRKAASQTEKARVNITKSIKDALRRIDANHAALGQHLRTAIRTGTYCAYTPDPRLHIEWKI